ncbi:mechanosensitive ion channel family protein [Aegicerativicinus sediminis]
MEITTWINKAYDLLLEYGPKVLMAIVIWIIGIWIIKIVVKNVRKRLEKNDHDPSLKNFLTNLLDWVLKVVLILAVLSVVGFEPTSFAAVIAAAGLAIGLALQGSLANFAGGVLIMLFKPIKIGDYIEAQGEAGTVKEIEIFTTKLLSPDNKEIIIPNGALSNNNIVNYSSQPQRRIDMVFGVGYDSDIKQTKEILMQQLTSHPNVLQDPPPVVALTELGDSSINFVARPWVKTENYWPTYFAIMENTKNALDAAGIEIPYPHNVQINKQE